MVYAPEPFYPPVPQCLFDEVNNTEICIKTQIFDWFLQASSGERENNARTILVKLPFKLSINRKKTPTKQFRNTCTYSSIHPFINISNKYHPSILRFIHLFVLFLRRWRCHIFATGWLLRNPTPELGRWCHGFAWWSPEWMRYGKSCQVFYSARQ